MLWWLVQNTLVAGVLAGIVAIICRWSRPSPAIRHALWLIVLIKLIAPPVVYWPWSADHFWQPISQRFVESSIVHSNDTPEVAPDDRLGETPPTVEAPGQAIEIVLIPTQSEEEPQFLDFSSLPFPAVQGERTPDSREAEPSCPAWWMSNSMESLVVQAWLIGALAMAMWQLARLGRFRQLLTEGYSPPEWLIDQVEELASVQRIRPPEIVVLPGIASPIIWALGRGRLIWPEGLLDHLPESSRQCVLIHELAHLRRRDHWVSWMQLVGGCLCWWNPLFWFVNRQVRENAELACDAWVVTTLPDGRRAYAEALIEVAQIMSQAEAPALGLGLGDARRRREFERRLIMIMGAGIPCKPSLRGLVVVGLLAVAALPGWSQDEPPRVPQPPAAPAPNVPAPPVGVAPPAAPPLPVQGLAPVTAPATPEFPPPVVTTPAGPYASAPSLGPVGGDSGDADARLRAIEQQLQALIKEVKGMRTGGANKPVLPPGTRHVAPGANPPPAIYSVPPQAGALPASPRNWAQSTTSAPKSGEVTLSRATYELPPAKAEALSALFKDSKGPAVEIKSEDGKVTVTTTPEAQHVIGALVGMLQGKAGTPHAYYYRPVTTYEAVPAVPAVPATR